GWDFNFSIWVSGLIVLLYIYLGGLTSAIYNEVLQFFLIVLGFIPLVYLGLRDAGGWQGLTERLNVVATAKGYASGAWTDSWAHLGSPSANPMGVDRKSTRLNSSHQIISYAVFCSKKKTSKIRALTIRSARPTCRVIRPSNAKTAVSESVCSQRCPDCPTISGVTLRSTFAPIHA